MNRRIVIGATGYLCLKKALKSVLTALLLVHLIVLAALPVWHTTGYAQPLPSAQTLPATSSGRAALPLYFEQNQGQADGEVKFLARAQGYTLFLSDGEARMALKASAEQRLRLRLMGGNQRPLVRGGDELAARSNYLIGNQPEQWHRDVPLFASVRYEQVYPGIDLLYYGKQQQIEYDFIVAPGAQPDLIAMDWQGADEINIRATGDLAIKIGAAEIVQRRPVIYQERGGRREIVAGNYRWNADNTIGFEITAYDQSLPLVIDPVLEYSTYLGTSAFDQINSMAVDAQGNVYVVGLTNSQNLPVLNAYQNTCGCIEDGFVAKLDPEGRPVFITYLGGSSNDTASAVAVDSSGNVYVTGTTQSTNYPVTPGAFRRTCTGCGDREAFVTKLSAAGNALLYSTYLNGSQGDEGRDIAVDAAGNAYVVGFTNSTDFNTTPGAVQTQRSGTFLDAFAVKLDAAGSDLIFGTYLGGTRDERANGVAVDAEGNVYIAGETASRDFPFLASSYQPFHTSFETGGPFDPFITKLNPAGTAIIYATSISNGPFEDRAWDIAVDGQGQAYVVGDTFSPIFPTTPGVFMRAPNGAAGFLAKFSADGTELLLSTLVNSHTLARTVALDGEGNIYVAGLTSTSSFNPNDHPWQPGHAGANDMFVARFDPAASILESFSVLGGSGDDITTGMGLDGAGNIYIAGYTNSINFPIASPYQANFGGPRDGVVAKIARSAGVLQFSQAAYSINEDGNSITILVTRVDGSDGPVTVEYATSDGTGRSGVDYTAVSGRLSFIAGETTKFFTIPIINNTIAQCGKTVNLRLSNATGGAVLGAQASALLTIAEND